MKISIKIVALALMMGFTLHANAQETAEATATASATIIAPIQLAKSVDMNFGDIIATTAGGTIVLAVDGGRIADAVQLPSTGAVGVAAEFTVTGTGTYTFDITLPAGGYEIVNAANAVLEDRMTITAWNHDAGEAPVLDGGNATFNVGATLNLVPNQNPGAYIGEDPFAVTVNYN